MRVRRGVVITNKLEAEEESVAVEGGDGTASPQSDLLPILLRTPPTKMSITLIGVK